MVVTVSFTSLVCVTDVLLGEYFIDTTTATFTPLTLKVQVSVVVPSTESVGPSVAPIDPEVTPVMLEAPCI